MKLYCARHGHAQSTPDEAGVRELSPQGRHEVMQVSNHLALHHCTVSHVMHSPKTRTRQTAEILSQKMAPALDVEATDWLLPDAAVFPLLEHIQTWSDDTLLVGHMPFISNLVSNLVVGNDVYDLVRFTPGTVVCLERCESQRWMISWILRPDLVVT